MKKSKALKKLEHAKNEAYRLAQENLSLKEDLSKLSELVQFYDEVSTVLGMFIRENADVLDGVYVRKVSRNDKTTTIKWSDGSKTTAKCLDEDTYDAQKGALICIAKKFLPASDVRKALSTEEDKVKNRGRLEHVYKSLNHSDRDVRIAAQREWEALPFKTRQSVKAKIGD